MTNKIKQEYHHLALAAGGAHYPTVMGDLGTRFADTLLQEILQLCVDNPQSSSVEIASAIKQQYNLR